MSRNDERLDAKMFGVNRQGNLEVRAGGEFDKSRGQWGASMDAHGNYSVSSSYQRGKDSVSLQHHNSLNSNSLFGANRVEYQRDVGKNSSISVEHSRYDAPEVQSKSYGAGFNIKF